MPKGDRLLLKADPLDGTTPVSNLLLEATAMSKLSGLEKGAILYLWRQTYGWQNGEGRLKEREIPLEEWQLALNTTKPMASTILKKLSEKRVISRIPLGTGKGYRYTMNTHINEWNHNCLNTELLREYITVTQNHNGTVTQTRNPHKASLHSPKEILNKYKEKDSTGKEDNVIKNIPERDQKFFKGKYGHMVQTTYEPKEAGEDAEVPAG